MAKGTYRKKRLKVLEDLEEHDPQWADQIRDLRATNPQAYRKQLIRAEVALAAATGRKLTLSMRPKRFGGDEDPALVRRVLELRKAYPQLTRGVDMAAVFGRPSPDSDEADLGPVDGWKQHRTPDLGDPDLGPVDGWKQNRTPDLGDPDLGSVDGWKQNRTPDTDAADLGSVDGWKQKRTPLTDASPGKPPKGSLPRGRAPEVAERPQEDPTAPKPTTRQAGDRPRVLGRRGAAAQAPKRQRAPARSASKANRPPAAPATPEPDLSILDGSISTFKKALATGEHDAFLDALEQAEKAGKGRKGVFRAIDARR